MTNFGNLTQNSDDASKWTWVVDGKEIPLTTSQLVDPRKFRAACERAGVPVPSYSRPVHEFFVSEALAAMRKSHAA